MKNLILKFKETPEYEVLSEIFKVKRLGYAILLNVCAISTMYGLLELYLIFKYGF